MFNMLKKTALATIFPCILIFILTFIGTAFAEDISGTSSAGGIESGIKARGQRQGVSPGDALKTGDSRSVATEELTEAEGEGSSRQKLETKLKELSQKRAADKRKKEDLREIEKKRIYQGTRLPGKSYKERLADPGEVSAVDEARIERLLGADLQKDAELEPFGRAFFLKGEDISGSLETVTAPSTYALGPGDSLKIIVWSDLGDETVYDVTVNPEGQVYIPILGVMGVSGLTVGEFQETVLGTLSEKFKHFKGQVTLSKVRTLQIFVAGEVRKPGAMIVSALATAFHALYRAGGPSEKGSMRSIRVLRGNQPISEIDLYQYFLKGDKSQDVNLESGDTIFVPPVGERVTVKGELIRPGIFEILGEKSLADVLSMSGGIDASAYTGRIKVYRWQGASRRKIIDINAAEGSGSLASFKVGNGDEIEVERATEEIGNRVRVEGAVTRPGEYAVTQGANISSILRKAGGITAEAAQDCGQIIRKLDQGREQILSFDLGKALRNVPSDDLPIKSLDWIKIFFASEIKADIRYVTIVGAVRQPGEYVLREGLRLRALILRARGLTVDSAGEAEVAAAKADGTTSEIRRVNLSNVMKSAADPDNIVLRPLDKVTVFSRGGAIIEPEIVVLMGEVSRPGPYALKRKGETITELIKRAGGFTSCAFLDGIVFMRNTEKIAPSAQIEAAEKVRGELFEQADLDLRSDLLRSGAKLTDVPRLETGKGAGKEAGKEDGKEDGKENGKVLGVSSGEILETGEKSVAGEVTETSVAAKTETSQFAHVERSSRSMIQKAVRIPIRLAEAMNGNGNGNDKTRGSRFDLVLEDGDQITIPSVPSTVSVVGAVVNPTTLIYQEHAGPRSYIELAGGFSDHSNHSRTMVIRPNGEVIALRRVREIKRGDIIMVPPKAKLVRKDKIQEGGQVAQILGNLAVVYKVAIQNK